MLDDKLIKKPLLEVSYTPPKCGEPYYKGGEFEPLCLEEVINGQYASQSAQNDKEKEMEILVTVAIIGGFLALFLYRRKRTTRKKGSGPSSGGGPGGGGDNNINRR